MSDNPEGGCFVAMRSVAAACLLYSAGERTEPEAEERMQKGIAAETGKPIEARGTIQCV